MADRAHRYNEMAVKGGSALSDMTHVKDLKLANSWLAQGHTPEDWMALDDAGRDTFAQGLGYKKFGQGGKLGRQTHAEGAKDVFDMMSKLLGR